MGHSRVTFVLFPGGPGYRHYERVVCAPNPRLSGARREHQLESRLADSCAQPIATPCHEPGPIHGLPDHRPPRCSSVSAPGKPGATGLALECGIPHHGSARAHHHEAEHRHRLPVARRGPLPVDAVQPDSQHPTLVCRFRGAGQPGRIAYVVRVRVPRRSRASTSCCSRMSCNCPFPAGWPTLQHSTFSLRA